MDIALLHDVACRLVHEICMEAPLAPACDRRGSVLLGALFLASKPGSEFIIHKLIARHDFASDLQGSFFATRGTTVAPCWPGP